MKFDPNKPHGVICGEFHGARYEQAGRFFGADGDEIAIGDEPQSDEQPAEKPQAQRRGRKPKPVELPAQAEPAPADDDIEPEPQAPEENA